MRPTVGRGFSARPYYDRSWVLTRRAWRAGLSRVAGEAKVRDARSGRGQALSRAAAEAKESGQAGEVAVPLAAALGSPL